MALNSSVLVNALASHAAATGRFDVVNGHEPKNAPGGNLSCAIWVQDYKPASSGLASTSMRLVFNVRLYTSMLQEPVDMIDPDLLDATDLLLADYRTGRLSDAGRQGVSRHDHLHSPRHQ